MTTTLQTFNGYTNRFTWLVMLWIQNDPMLWEQAEDAAKAGDSLVEADRNLESLIDGYCRGFLADSDASLPCDLLVHALGEVNWTELVEHIREE